MSTPAPSRKFQFGPGWLLFFGMVALLLFNKNSRNVVKTLKERMGVEAKRMSTDFEGLKSALEKKKPEGK